MIKRIFLSVMILILCMAGFSASAEETEKDTVFLEKTVKVMTNGEEAGKLPLRFYDETPNVPYLGIDEYSQFLNQRPLKLRKEADGTVVLENETGAELIFNPDAGTITVPDWNAFFDLPLPLETEAKGWKDTATRFIRMKDVSFDGEAAPVVLDYASYGISVYADDKDIYLPVSTLSNMMTDIATNHILYNGESLYAQRMSLDGTFPEGLYQTEQLRAQMQGARRPDDIRKQCYADLCFTFDHFFGHPGKAPLDKAVAEMGLDQALSSLGKKGERLKKDLQSADLTKYLSAMDEVFMKYLGDGHTLFTSASAILADNMDSAKTFLGIPVLALDYTMDLASSPVYLKQALNETITLQRSTIWGDAPYREYENTAIIRLDSFMPDEAAWDRYYKGKGEFPEDSLGIVLTGLKKASENPKIENVIFDLSCNSGGSPDVMMAILEVATGQTQLYGRHKLTDRNMTFTFEADTNFDGVYDEKDKELRYDFHYGVLVTRHAFSCGNLFPIIIQEAGAVLIGEPSSGGSCCVQTGSDAQAFTYMMSSAQWQLTDSRGNDVEGGCRIDLPIEPEGNRIVDTALGLFGVDEGLLGYENFFDEAYLSDLMNEYFQEEEADLAA